MTEPRVRLTSSLLRRAALVSAQVLLIVVALWALRNVVKHLSYVIVPVLVALLLTALLEPVVSWLTKHRWPRSLAVIGALIVGLVVVGGLVTFVVFAVLDAFEELRQRILESIAQLQNWLAGGPFEFSGDLLERVQQWLSGNQQAVVSQAVGAFSTISAFLVGLVVAIVLFVMFLYDAPKMWAFALKPWRPRTREIVDDAGRRAYRSLVVYVRVTALVSLIDALGIGIGLAIVGVPLTVPLAALVFLGGFVPYIGAVLSGMLAVLVTFVSNGLVAALIITGVVLAVQQLEGEVLQPVLQGNFSRLHPAAVLVVLIIGGAEGGIAGVLFAVPVLAATRGAVLAVVEHREREESTGESGTEGTAEPNPRE